MTHKTCIPCGASCEEDALTCPACGEGSFAPVETTDSREHDETEKSPGSEQPAAGLRRRGHAQRR